MVTDIGRQSLSADREELRSTIADEKLEIGAKIGGNWNYHKVALTLLRARKRKGELDVGRLRVEESNDKEHLWKPEKYIRSQCRNECRELI